MLIVRSVTFKPCLCNLKLIKSKESLEGKKEENTAKNKKGIFEMDYRKCEVKNCPFVTMEDVKLRAFPSMKNDKERCLKWIALCGKPDLLQKQTKHRKICDHHFEEKYKLNKHLSNSAVPTLYLPEGVRDTEMDDPDDIDEADWEVEWLEMDTEDEEAARASASLASKAALRKERVPEIDVYCRGTFSLCREERKRKNSILSF